MDERGNASFYNVIRGKRGGEDYVSPTGWIGFGIEVIKRYGSNTDWLANDGRPGEWAVAFRKFLFF